ncbi:uncharacterized protein KRP23_9485 [Phytophthora ramorum]|uniref:uncharacterized protein n=1 Tax=Phytophthora ramorum TaxID=164328 RepID=UPI00309F39F1|nr:hypothetical protein KRP23_9485 [Phytophthora ramorum]
MRKIVVAVDSTPSMPEVVVPPPAAIFPKGIVTIFVDTAGEILPQSLTTATALHEQRIDDEFERWLTTTTTLQGASFSDFEPVLTFWKCQQDIGTFRLLPLVTRVFFSLSSSSAHIERGFGTAGRMVKPQRNSLAPYSADITRGFGTAGRMVKPQRNSLAPYSADTTLLNCERSYVNIAQCPKFSAVATSEHIPSNVMVNIRQEQDDNRKSLAEFFSTTRFNLEL